jgi:hypothetical protein
VDPRHGWQATHPRMTMWGKRMTRKGVRMIINCHSSESWNPENTDHIDNTGSQIRSGMENTSSVMTTDCHSSPTILCENPSPSNSNVVPLEGTLSFHWDKMKGWIQKILTTLLIMDPRSSL